MTQNTEKHEPEEIIIEIIEIEEYAKIGKEIPRGKKYQIRIDKIKYVVHVESMTGRELLTLAGKIPVEKYRLDQKMKGGHTRKIELDQIVSFVEPGVERFMTLPLDQTEG